MIKLKTVLKVIGPAIMMASMFFLSSCVTRHETSVSQYVNSSLITFKVKEKLLKDPQAKSTHIAVTTYKDTVTLSGYVDNHAQEERAIEVARSVKGVKYVVDNLAVKSK